MSAIDIVKQRVKCDSVVQRSNITHNSGYLFILDRSVDILDFAKKIKDFTVVNYTNLKKTQKTKVTKWVKLQDGIEAQQWLDKVEQNSSNILVIFDKKSVIAVSINNELI